MVGGGGHNKGGSYRDHKQSGEMENLLHAGEVLKPGGGGVSRVYRSVPGSFLEARNNNGIEDPKDHVLNCRLLETFQWLPTPL
jgi:hypothetical protein